MKRFKETAIGLSFIATIALLFAGIQFFKGRNIFSSKAYYYVRYQDVTGLSDASPIYANGVRIGIVDDIHFNYQQPDDILVRILVDRRVQIPKGSVALLETELLGSVNVNLLMASADFPTLLPGDTLQGALNKGLMTEVATLMPALKHTIHQADTLLSSVQALLKDSSVSHILHQTDALTADARLKVNELSELMQRLSVTAHTFNDVGLHLDTVAGRINEATQHMEEEAWIARMGEVITRLDTLSSLLTEEQGTAGKLITDPQLYDDLDKTCQQASKLIEDVRQNPGRYIRLFGKVRE